MNLHPRLQALERRTLPSGLTLLVARTPGERGRGLARLDELPSDHGLLFERCRSVHTVGMRFALDLLWLGAAGELVRLDAAVAPRRLRGCRHARGVIECAAGAGEQFAASIVSPAVSAAHTRGNRP